MRNSKQAFGIAGPLGPAQLACLRSWRASGYHTALFHVGDRPLPRLLQRIADDYRYHPGPAAAPETLRAIWDECSEIGLEGITALSEQLALALHEHWASLGSNHTKLLLNPRGIYDTVEPKSTQVALANLVGLPVLPTIPVELDTIDQLDFATPWVLRPDIARTVRPMFKAELVSSRDELHRFLGSITTKDAKIIAQPFVSGPNIVIHAARASDGSWDHHEAFETEIKSGGLAVSLRPAPLDSNIHAACQRLEKHLGLRGVFHYDFVLDQQTGKSYFLEVNPRLGGTTAKVFAAGYDEPAMLIATYDLRNPPENLPPGQRRPSTSRIAAVRCLLSTLMHQQSILDYPAGSKVQTASKVLKALLSYPDEVFSLFDPVGNLAYLSQAGT